ncbi:hypothetical protein F4779DRAFT_566868 [Xylariaceae sp. FL0662B]|nr:hypothetical protein F4779DRAFT_566868 [Xylariaceae sp. FL0662B]
MPRVQDDSVHTSYLFIRIITLMIPQTPRSIQTRHINRGARPAPKMDWLAALQTSGLFLYSALKFILKLFYIITIPLHYPLYYVLTCIAFLLSPFLYMFNAVVKVPFAVVDLLARLKYLYVYLACAVIIGICAGCILHGTSSFIFVLLGVDGSRQRGLERRKYRQSLLKSEDGEADEPQSATWSPGSSSRSSLPTIISRHAKSRKEASMDEEELFEKQWKLLRSTEKPGRRRNGLISQTILEETSESDFS